MKILLAPNSFKGSINAFEICQGLKDGLTKANPSIKTAFYPVADGGDYTMRVIVQAKNGTIEKVKASDPLGRAITVEYGILPDGTAIIEMASASGLRLLSKNEMNPMLTNTFGTGQLFLHALNKGCKNFIIGLGGSATVDCGTGILSALGINFSGKNGQSLPLGGGSLSKIEKVDIAGFDKRIGDCDIKVLCDVENPLLGENGAAHVFAPQKGATPKMIKKLEKGIKNFNELTINTINKDMSTMKHGGAAGGISAALTTYMNAELVSGIDYLLDFIEIDKAIKNADIVITSEGKLDAQTKSGKAPLGVANRAKKFDKPVIFIGGHIPVDTFRNKQVFDAIFSICNGPQPLEEAIKNSPDLINSFGFNLGKILAL
jgi:glycerate 2-kinase